MVLGLAKCCKLSTEGAEFRFLAAALLLCSGWVETED